MDLPELNRTVSLLFLLIFVLTGCTPSQPEIISPGATVLNGLTATRSINPPTRESSSSLATLTEKAIVDTTQTAMSAVLTTRAENPPVTPTSVATVIPSVTRVPSRTPVPTRTRKPSNTPTQPGPTATPAPQDAPIRVFSPVSFSRLISPIRLSMSVIPGANGNVYMQLIGEQSEILYEKKWVFPYASGRRTTINEEIEFAIPAVSEAARLKVYTFDEYGRLMSLTTEDFILLSIGKSDLAEAENLSDAFALSRPYPDQIIKNNKIIINGMTRCRIDCRLFFEVVDITDKQLTSLEQQSILQASLDYQPIYFELPLKVNSPTWVRLILHQQDIFTRDDIAVSSVLVKLLP